MSTQTVTKAPSRKKSKTKTAQPTTKKSPVVEVKAKQKKSAPVVAQTAPAVDVPTGKEKEVKELTLSKKKEVHDYMVKVFEKVTQKVTDLVTRECAECVIYGRSPKASEAETWDTAIIEEVIGECFKTSPKQEEAPVATQTRAAEAPQEVAKEEKKEEQVKVSTKVVSKKAAVKSSAPKNAKVKKVKVAQKKATKPQDAKPTPTAPIGDARALVKKSTGVKAFELACEVLKAEKKIWVQSQDIPAVAKHLFEVHTGKAKLSEKGLPGLGEKSYGRRRLIKNLQLIKEML